MKTNMLYEAHILLFLWLPKYEGGLFILLSSFLSSW